jgi:hypothetical protein
MVSSPKRTAWEWAALTLFLSALTCVVTFPQVLRLRTGVHDFGDPLLNVWALAWNAHAMITPGVSVFDANIFYPERGTLALSETLLFPSLLVAPLQWLGTGPITAYNLTLLSGFVLSGLAMFLLVKSVTGAPAGALIAATAFAVYPFRVEQYAHLQLQLIYLLPVALYALHRIVRGTGRYGAAVLLGTALAAQFFSCVYYFVFFASVALVFVGMLAVVSRPKITSIIGPALAGVLLAGITIAPAIPVYLRNKVLVGERTAAEIGRGSAEPRDFLRGNHYSLLFGDPRRPGPPEHSLFPGFTVIALAVAGVWSAPALALPYVGALGVALDGSLGVNGFTFPWLYEHVLPYRALRVPARFSMIAGMALAVLAGVGASRIVGAAASPMLRGVLLTLMIGGIAVESLNRRIELVELPSNPPAVYAWLRTRPPAPVLEYPVGGLEGRIGPQDATYMYYSTFHWRPLLNGYSGFTPPSYRELLERMEAFPSTDTTTYLRVRGVKYLLVHEAFYLRGGFGEDVAILDVDPGLRPVARFASARHRRTFVYEVVDSSESVAGSGSGS